MRNTAIRDVGHTSSVDGRIARKQRTREALMDAALRLLAEQSFGGLSLREVAREAGVVPTAFYRHFPNMEALALALVEDSFRTLREMIRSARDDPTRFDHVVRSSAEILVRHIHANPLHFRFIARERSSGVPALRNAIRGEIRLFASELATDLARFPALAGWTTEDLQMMAGLLVNTMVSVAESIIDAPPGDARAEADIVRIAEKQMTLVALGATQFKSGR
jgi:AcrR family transcriptional regulator